MKFFGGLFLVALGIVFGAYIGFYQCFVLGIVDFIEAVNQEEVVGMDVALSIGRIAISSFAGSMSAFLFVLPGMGLIASD